MDINIKTKANIGDNVYFIYKNNITCDKVKNIIYSIYSNVHSELLYKLENDFERMYFIEEDKIELSFEQLMLRLEETFIKTGGSNGD